MGNFRDAAGARFATAGGKHVRRGVVYRSNALTRDAADAAVLDGARPGRGLRPPDHARGDETSGSSARFGELLRGTPRRTARPAPRNDRGVRGTAIVGDTHRDDDVIGGIRASPPARLSAPRRLPRSGLIGRSRVPDIDADAKQARRSVRLTREIDSRSRRSALPVPTVTCRAGTTRWRPTHRTGNRGPRNSNECTAILVEPNHRPVRHLSPNHVRPPRARAAIPIDVPVGLCRTVRADEIEGVLLNELVGISLRSSSRNESDTRRRDRSQNCRATIVRKNHYPPSCLIETKVIREITRGATARQRRIRRQINCRYFVRVPE
ncbi:hypothetical protein [Tsukamurella sp. NPDC003166]|uniref:tyrosine-protein phosphatase n=1 Tax=Tsukamurella sp. NPDC003166 TaxID=3154444 RepID=UPI0033A14178